MCEGWEAGREAYRRHTDAWLPSHAGWDVNLAPPLPSKAQNCLSQNPLPCPIQVGKICKVAMKCRAWGLASGKHTKLAAVGAVAVDIAATPSSADD